MSVDFRQRTPGELARILWRRKWLIMLPTAAIAVAVAYVVWRLPNVYESTTLLTVRPASIATESVGQLSDSDLTLRINNITQEVTSRSSLQPLIERYGLYARERARGESMEELVELMRTRDLEIKLNTTRNDITNGFFLYFRGQEPRTTQAVTADLAGKYVESQKRASSEETSLTKDFFDQRVQQEKEKLDEIDRRRLQVMQRNIRNLPSATQALVGQLGGLRDEQQTRIAEVGRLNDQITSLNRLVTDLAKVNQQQVEEVVAQMQDPKSTAAYAELVKRRAQLESDSTATSTRTWSPPRARSTPSSARWTRWSRSTSAASRRRASGSRARWTRGSTPTRATSRGSRARSSASRRCSTRSRRRSSRSARASTASPSRRSSWRPSTAST
jgi:uncharacterized protein involved in exopolysaccharide biosynthesis